MLTRILTLAAAAALAVPAAASAVTATATDTISGIELPSASIATVGNFVGLAGGPLPGLWDAQVTHDQLVYTVGTPTAITGGSFTLRTASGATADAVTGGTVTPTNLPAGCANQTFALSLTLSGGSFTGVLTHYRTLLFGACTTYWASVAGTANLDA